MGIGIDRDGLLAGTRILDLSIWRPGPYATQLLAEIGADVIKVEPPGGDPMRSYPELFASLSANKRSIVLDLKDPDERRQAMGLAAEADVVMEGFRPGVAERLGVGYDAVRDINRDVIYCSLSGLGQDGPLSLVPGHDLNYQAWSGSLAPDGGSPVVPAIPVADLAGGLAAAFAVCAALVRRLQTGEGERIDVAMTDLLATWTGAAQPRARDVELDIASTRGVLGYGTFETRDGRYITLGVLTEDHFWRALCTVLGLDDCAHLGFADRMQRLQEFQPRLTDAIAKRDRDELVDSLMAADVPVAPVLDRSEMLGLDHLKERRVVTSDPWLDPATGYPVRFAVHQPHRTTPPPEVDEHHGATFRPR
jgi:crotonobetainyl-CoA:carnitine CoA-transferase CaiB-like acyl-CoA transferase